MTFNEILLDIYDRTGHAQSPSSEVSRRIKRYVNRWNRKILSSQGMTPLRFTQITASSVADQAAYGIALQKIRYITEATTDRRIYEKPLAWYREQVPDPSAWTGTPDYWVNLGWARNHTRPSNASELFAKSTTADTATVYLEAIRSNGYRVSLSLTLNGTTAVTFSASITDIVDIVSVSLSAAAAGVVTVHEDSGSGTELSRIPIGQTYPRFLRFALVPTPSAVISYTIDGIAPLVDLVQNTDESFIDPDFHDLLVDGGIHDEWNSRGKEKEARALRGEIEARIRRLRATLFDYDEASEESDGRSFEDTVSLPIA